jgi:hypothetical protein
VIKGLIRRIILYSPQTRLKNDSACQLICLSTAAVGVFTNGNPPFLIAASFQVHTLHCW